MSLDAARVAPEKAVLRPALPMFLRPGWNGTDMGKMTYAEQLAHPNWQRKRLEVLEDAEWTCQGCGETEITLHVHHKRYVKGRMAWEYETDELQALCKDCHAKEHKTEAAMVEVQHQLANLHGEGRVRALLTGYAVACGCCDADDDHSAGSWVSDSIAYNYGELLALLDLLNKRHPVTGLKAVAMLVNVLLRRDSPDGLDVWHAHRGSVPSTAPLTTEAQAAFDAFAAYVAALNAERAAAPDKGFE